MTLKFNELQQGDLSQPCLEGETEQNISHVQTHQCICTSQGVTGPRNMQIKLFKNKKSKHKREK